MDVELKFHLPFKNSPRDWNAMRTSSNRNKIISPHLAWYEALRVEGIARRSYKNETFLISSFVIRPCKLIYRGERFLTLERNEYTFTPLMYYNHVQNCKAPEKCPLKRNWLFLYGLSLWFTFLQKYELFSSCIYGNIIIIILQKFKGNNLYFCKNVYMQ
jgi:hypothetical protein